MKPLLSPLPPQFVRAMELRALRTICLLGPEGSSQQHADRYSEGEPDADVSSQHSENGAQPHSQRNAQSMEFRFVRHTMLQKASGFRLPTSGDSGCESRKPEAGSLFSLRLRQIARLQGFVSDLADLAQQLR